ncbi:MAG TPA: hypothetical protein VGO11_17575 [Chthoniobacteraceae bacterium]|jgi:hypothetical protein|nr:hypothetical protein [Chthoniobacteraceae bacterium]
MALPQHSHSTETATETSAPPPPLKLLPKPGRPSLFNPERTAAICEVIEQEGISDSAAGALAGVPASTLARWKVEHEGFALELEAARARFELALVRAIRTARRRDGSPDWRAAAWLLKHSSAEGCGPNSRMRKVKAPEPEQRPERAEQSENCAILPETHGDASEPSPAGPRLSRRERRAEERRLAKAGRVKPEAGLKANE